MFDYQTMITILWFCSYDVGFGSNLGPLENFEM